MQNPPTRPYHRAASTPLSPPPAPELPDGSAPRSKIQDLRSPDWRDVLNRKYGEPLCPEWFPLSELEKTKRLLGTYSYSALYQQRPVPSEGGFFKRHWFRYVDFPPPGVKWIRGYDLGLSGAPGADYSATAKVGFDKDGNMYIADVRRNRFEYPEQRLAIMALIMQEPRIEHVIELAANGNAVVQDLRRARQIRGAKLRGIHVKDPKLARALAWNALAEEGRLFLVRGPWTDFFIQEACSFPSGTYDDQIDAVSLAVHRHGHRSPNLYAF